jgi:hypothetical protein
VSSAAAASAPAPALAAFVVAAFVLAALRLVVAGVLLGLWSLPLFGLERSGYERVVLGSQVGLVGPSRVVASVGGVGGELVLPLEGPDIGHRHLELVRDPRVGPSLPHPSSDLVQLRL